MGPKSRNASENLILQITVRFFYLIPLAARKMCFGALFAIFYHLFRRHRLIAIHNLKRAFPDKDMGEIISIAKGAFRNTAIVAAEFFNIPYLTRDNINNFVEVDGLEKCDNAFKEGKGLILFSAHFGNWELLIAAVSILIRPLLGVYRPLDNPFLDNLVYYVRSSTRSIVFPKEKVIRQMLKSLRKNEAVGLLIDQNMAQREGVFVGFFNRPACTTDSLAHLALLTGAPVIPVFLLRLTSGKYRLIIGDEIKVVDTGEFNSDVVINTQNFTRSIEKMVALHPEQWLWLHNRWKTKPWQIN